MCNASSVVAARPVRNARGTDGWPGTAAAHVDRPGVADPLMRKIRYLDKLIDELAKGKKMTSILRE